MFQKVTGCGFSNFDVAKTVADVFDFDKTTKKVLEEIGGISKGYEKMRSSRKTG